MSLLNRSPISIGRGERKLRDDRVFVVATDDTYAPSQYFKHLPLPRVKIVVLPTPVNSGLSAPVHVVERLKDAFQSVSQRKQVQSGDEFWVLLDTDHYFQANNIAGTLAAMQNAQHVGFEIAVSNPCFELWLLLHHYDVTAGTVFKNCDEVGQQIRTVLGGYNKTSIKAGQFTLDRVPVAIRRARALESGPNAPWPSQTGTHVFRLMERVIPAQL
jgi:hypothetical protein